MIHQVGDLADGAVLAVGQDRFQGIVKPLVDAGEKILFPLAAVDAIGQVESEEQVENHAQRNDSDTDAQHDRIADKLIVQQVKIICQVIKPGQNFIHRLSFKSSFPPHNCG